MNDLNPPDQAVAMSMPGASLAPLLGIVLALLTVWIAAMPRPAHLIALDTYSECPPGLALPDPLVAHTVAIDADGRYAWDGQPLASLSALQARLTALAETKRLDETELRISAHRQASYGTVIAVAAAAQRQGVSRLIMVGSDDLASTVACRQLI